MHQSGKGHAVRHYVSDYCVLDLETTGLNVNSAKIVEFSAIRVRNSKVVDTFSSLANPKCHIPEDATAVNNITDDMVQNAPPVDVVLECFLSFIGTDILIGYNHAGFDIRILNKLLEDLNKPTLTNNYIDVFYMAKRCIQDVDNYRLETVGKYYDLNTTGMHRALKDCYLTNDVYQKLCEQFGDNAFSTLIKKPKYVIRYTPETLALRELQSLIETIIDDKSVSLIELSKLYSWLDDHAALQGNYLFDKVSAAIEKVLPDGVIIPEELNVLQNFLADYLDPVNSMESQEDIKTIQGKHIVLTGDFSYGAKQDVGRLIIDAGGVLDATVKKTTDYIVVGSKGNPHWSSKNFGKKVLKALELIEKGYPIEIIKEQGFLEALQKIDAPPDGDNDETFVAVDDSVWKQNIKNMLESLVANYNLPEGSLYLSNNYGKTAETENKVLSHTICIWEPSYPPVQNEKPSPNLSVMTIYLSQDQNRPFDVDLAIKDYQEADLQKYRPRDAVLSTKKQSDHGSGTVRVRIDRNSPNLLTYIRRNISYCLDRYTSNKAAPFGCCGSYIQCSDTRKCVHKNQLYAKACEYRKTIEQGKAFYGKNQNIDYYDQSIRVKSESIDLNSDEVFSGSAHIEEKDKKVRKLLGLPTTKQLVYYTNLRDAKSIQMIKDYRLIKVYNTSFLWFIVQITLEDQSTHRIHSGFLSEMQKPNFIANLDKQMS